MQRFLLKCRDEAAKQSSRSEADHEKLRLLQEAKHTASTDQAALQVRVQELQKHVQDLQDADAKRITDFAAEREQFQSDAALDTLRRNCDKELQALRDAESATMDVNAALQKQVRKLEGNSEKYTSECAAQHEHLRRNAALEQEAMQTEFQTQLRELTDVIQGNCSIKLEEVESNRSALQTQLQELQDVAAKCALDLAAEHINCSVWARAGKCESSPEIMHVVCKTSCKSNRFDRTLGAGWTLHPSNSTGCCCDFNDFCVEWAEQGQCESNPEFMLTRCRYSCGACHNNSIINEFAENT